MDDVWFVIYKCDGSWKAEEFHTRTEAEDFVAILQAQHWWDIRLTEQVIKWGKP